MDGQNQEPLFRGGPRASVRHLFRMKPLYVRHASDNMSPGIQTVPPGIQCATIRFGCPLQYATLDEAMVTREVLPTQAPATAHHCAAQAPDLQSERIGARGRRSLPRSCPASPDRACVRACVRSSVPVQTWARASPGLRRADVAWIGPVPVQMWPARSQAATPPGGRALCGRLRRCHRCAPRCSRSAPCRPGPSSPAR